MGLDPHFWLPNRLADKSQALVEAVNDFHYAMMNDFDRNEFYQKGLGRGERGREVGVEVEVGGGGRGGRGGWKEGLVILERNFCVI